MLASGIFSVQGKIAVYVFSSSCAEFLLVCVPHFFTLSYLTAISPNFFGVRASFFHFSTWLQSRQASFGVRASFFHSFLPDCNLAEFLLVCVPHSATLTAISPSFFWRARAPLLVTCCKWSAGLSLLNWPDNERTLADSLCGSNTFLLG